MLPNPTQSPHHSNIRRNEHIHIHSSRTENPNSHVCVGSGIHIAVPTPFYSHYIHNHQANTTLFDRKLENSNSTALADVFRSEYENQRVVAGG
jgi:hypothetical protein